MYWRSPKILREDEQVRLLFIVFMIVYYFTFLQLIVTLCSHLMGQKSVLEPQSTLSISNSQGDLKFVRITKV